MSQKQQTSNFAVFEIYCEAYNAVKCKLYLHHASSENSVVRTQLNFAHICSLHVIQSHALLAL
jgi:hypothetical protein